jgi:hypothetical protein
MIPPNVSFRMVLRRSPPRFVLVGVDNRTTSSSSSEPFPYYLHIDNCIFFIKRHVVLPEIQTHRLSILNRQNTRLNYPVKNKWIKSFIIPPNTSSVQSQVLFSHNIPTTIVLAFAPTDQVNGSIDTPPFVLGVCSLEYIQVKTEGDLNNTFEINMNPTHSLRLQAYQTVTTTNPDSFVVPKKAQVKVRLKSNDKFITCIVMGQLDSLIQIGKEYEIFGDINII